GVSKHGRVFIATEQGTILVGRRGSGAWRAEVIDAELASATLRRTTVEQQTTFEFEHQGTPYLGRAVPMTVGDLTWLVEVVVPERDYTQQIDAEARVALGLGILALVVAAAGGVSVARWIAGPLPQLAPPAPPLP